MSYKTVIPSLLLTLVITHGVAAEQLPNQSVLGADGQIYEIYAGKFSDLFPGHDSYDPEHQVLALDVIAPGEAVSRRLVPTTGGPVTETEPRLVYDKASDRLSLVWNAILPSGELLIQLTSYDADGWENEVHELYRSAGVQGDGQVSAPQVALTRDAYDLQAGHGQTLSADRATLHLLWQEREGNTVAVKYLPVLLVAGRYIGWAETFTLGTSAANQNSPENNTEGGANEGLFAAPNLTTSDRKGTVIVSYVDRDAGRLKTFDIGILPLELVYLSDEVQQQVLDLGSDWANGDLSSFADVMRIHIIGLGSSYGFHPAVVDYVADQVHAHLLEVGDGYSDLESLSDDLRDYAIDLTTSLFGSDLSAPANDDGSEIIEIDLSDLPIGDEGEQPAQILDLHLASEVPLPDISIPDASIFTSPAGDELIVAWSESDDEGDRLVYIEYTNTTGWSDPLSLEIGPRLDLSRAQQLLAERLR